MIYFRHREFWLLGNAYALSVGLGQAWITQIVIIFDDTMKVQQVRIVRKLFIRAYVPQKVLLLSVNGLYILQYSCSSIGVLKCIFPNVFSLFIKSHVNLHPASATLI